SAVALRAERQRAALRALLSGGRRGGAVVPGAMSGNVLLSLVVWTPLVGALLVLLVPRDNPQGARWAAFTYSLVTFLLSLGLWAGFRENTADFQFLEQY